MRYPYISAVRWDELMQYGSLITHGRRIKPHLPLDGWDSEDTNGYLYEEVSE